MPTQTLGVTFRYSHTIGRGETSGTGFSYPVAMARGEDDLMYVLSRSYEGRPDSMRITICTTGEEYIGEFGKGAPARNEAPYPDAMVWPTAMALDHDGQLYVVDDWLNSVRIFSKDGDPVGSWGVAGSGEGELSGPSGIDFDADDNIYLVDSGNNRVQKFTKDGSFLTQWGSEGDGEGQFNMPFGISVDKSGNVYVADWRNDRVQKFTGDGRFLMQFGTSGNGDGQFDRPTDVAVDADGYIYVCDWGNDRVQVITPEGKHVTTFTGDANLSKWGREKLAANPDMIRQRNLMRDSSAERAFWRPKAVEVDDAGRILILDGYRGRIQVYRKED